MNGYEVTAIALGTFILGLVIGSAGNRRVKIRLHNVGIEAGSVAEIQRIIDRLQKGPPLSDVKEWKQ